MLLYAVRSMDIASPTPWLRGWSDNAPVWTNHWLDALTMPADEADAELTLLTRHTGLPRQAFAPRIAGILNI